MYFSNIIYINLNMGIETKYEYIYYTVINTNELSPLTREEWFNDGFTWEKAINYIQHLFKTSEDKSVNNYKVDYAGYEQDIDFWIRTHERHKERPVFVQFHNNQQIKTTGEGSMFVLYEEEDYSEDEEDCFHIYPTSPDYYPADGLAGAGGRL